MQQLGETRQSMTKGLMQRIEGIINERKEKEFYILVHAKPQSNNQFIIRQKIIILNQRPPEMLACMLFKVDNANGRLTLEWALPGDWPTQAVEQGEHVPEVVASYNKLEDGLKWRMNVLQEEVKASTA